MADAPTACADFCFVNAPDLRGDQLAMMCEVWVADVCSAPWASKEGMKLAAVVSAYMQVREPKPVHMRDVESAYNMQPEETQRALKLLRLFGAIEDSAIERGRLTVKAHVSYVQRLRHHEMCERLAGLRASQASAVADQIASQSVEALRGVAGRDPGHLEPVPTQTARHMDKLAVNQ